MNGFPDAQVRGAAAQVTGHRIVDVRVGGLGVPREQRSGRHDLPGLTVPALRYVHLLPRHLQRMGPIRGEPLDRRDLPVLDVADGRLTGTNGPAVDMDGACPALGDTATVLRSFDIQFITQCPQQRHVGFYVEFVTFAIDQEFHGAGPYER